MIGLNFARQLLTLIRPERKRFVRLFILTAFAELLTLPLPFLFAWLIAQFLTDLKPGELGLFVIAVLALQVASAVLSVYQVRANRRFALDAANHMRRRYFAHLLRLPYAYYLDHQAGALANSYLNDVDDIDRAVTNFFELGLRSALVFLYSAIAILIWNPVIGLLAVVIIPITIAGQRRLRTLVAESSKRKVDLREQITGQVAEAVANITVLKSFTMEHAVTSQIDSLSDRFRYADVRLETYQSALRSLAAVILLFIQYGFFIVGGWMVVNGSLDMPSFLGQILLVGRFVGPLNNLLDYFNQLHQSEAALHKVQDRLATPPEGAQHQRADTTLQLRPGGVHLHVQNLRFRYRPELPLIEDWNFEARPGQTIAIVGPSGSGKTTLFHLLLGMFENYEGSIQVDRHELRDLSLTALRKQVGVVFQEHVLFNATVRENLLVAVDDPAAYTDADLWDVLRLAEAHEFVQAMPEALDTMIGVGGVKLSGGQRQRLALARVILKNPPLLLLDEATSALDSFSEKYIQHALRTLLTHRTSLVIAHRLSTITEADQILLVDRGRIIERGTHKQLLEQKGVYRKLFDAQVEGFISWDAAQSPSSSAEAAP